jgi:4-amino-4-deoxy-L-arabinose transferase-like glycosyltransferase
VLLLLLCLALFLPGLSGLPPTDRDESRYAQATRQMLESGDYIRIQFQGESRAKKPAGIYWLQALAVTLAGQRAGIWAYRLPSVAGAIIAVLLSFGFGQRLVGRPAALLAAAMLAASVLLVSEAHQAKTDAAQLACVLAAQGLLSRFYLSHPAGRPGFWPAMAFWLAQGCGILIKGPIVPLISLATILALIIADRRAGWLRGLRPLPGLLLVGMMVGPWAWAISQATEGQFIGQAVKTDLLPKLLGAQESHGAAPGTYLLLMSVTLWPASLFVIPALPQAIARRSEAATRFLLAWIIPNWLIFEAIPTKLPNYILPIYPALALLAGAWLMRPEARRLAVWQKIFALMWGLIGSALAIAFVAAPLALKMPPLWSLAPVTLLVLVASWLPVVALWRGFPQISAAQSLAAAVIAFAALFLLLPQRLTPLWVSGQIAEMVPSDAPLAAAGYHEPSLVFLHGTATLLTDGAGAAEFLLLGPDHWAAVESSDQAAFDARLAESGRRGVIAGRIDGFNAVRGKPAHIILWRLNQG